MPTAHHPSDSYPVWSLFLPVLGAILLALTWGRKDLSTLVLVVVGVFLVAAVLAAVIHAETVAARVGEPLGTLVLALSVTIIEVGLIVTIMAGGKEGASVVARDTVLSAVMICCGFIAGISILLGAGRDGVVKFRSEGPTSAVAAITTLATLSLILPTFTTTAPGPVFAPSQLAFAAVASLTVYGLFVVVQNIRNREMFVSVIVDENDTGRPIDAKPGPHRTAAASGGLVLSLFVVIGLAKVESPGIESVLDWLGLPLSFVGLVIASIVLLPEGIAAVRAARRRRIQTSLNLAYGSALASIGLTIPAVALATIWLDGPLVLGLTGRETVLMVLVLAISALCVIPGRATLLSGGLLVSIGSAYVVLAIVP